MPLRLESIRADRIDDVISVLCEAFRAYPVMEHVIGPGPEDRDRRLSVLVRFFVMRSARQDGPILGVVDSGSLVAVATVTFPAEPDVHPGSDSDGDRLWRALGDDARGRYETYKSACRPLEVDRRHHHLNMFGVRDSYRGRGTARLLLDAVRTLSEHDDSSNGVGLTTELPRNVALYQHFGYEIVGHTRVTPTLESWSCFLPTT